MIKLRPLLAIAVLTAVIAGCDKNKKLDEAEQVLLSPDTAGDNGGLVTEEQKVSYIIGMNIGSQFKADAFPVDMDTFTLGLRDALGDVKPKLSDAEAGTVIEAFKAKQLAKQEEAMKALAINNLKEGEKFLAENAKKDGVKVLPSGLQYKVITDGAGPLPAPNATVEVNYKGKLIDGTEFDSSYKRGVPAQFGVDQVIPGWSEALKLMKEGSKWELFIPPSLAYGPGGTGGVIGPNQTLLFEVFLVSAAAKPPAEPPAGAVELPPEAAEGGD